MVNSENLPTNFRFKDACWKHKNIMGIPFQVPGSIPWSIRMFHPDHSIPIRTPFPPIPTSPGWLWAIFLVYLRYAARFADTKHQISKKYSILLLRF